MPSYRFLLTLDVISQDEVPEQKEVCIEANSHLDAQLAILKEHTNNRTTVVSLDSISPDETPALVKARKGKKHPSRADRFSDAMGKVTDAKAVFEELRDELQNWRDNLPENLQDGTKAEELDTAIGELEDTISDAESVEGHDGNVEFPRMF